MGVERYENIDVIGSGAMATVWRARDTHLGRIVAIKRPHPAPSDSLVHERFRREARTAATVSHPNVVTVFDVGNDDNGPFLVMDFVDAPSLADVEWDPALARSVGIDIAAALGALHAADIVHRDVKPANVLVTGHKALLTDFGIARAIDDATLTLENTTFATPAYAAPEVIAHGSHSAASDVYSLAVVLREMVTGRRALPVTDTQVRVTDRWWGPIIESATSPDPAIRPSAGELEQQLRALPPSATSATTATLDVDDGRPRSGTTRMDTAATAQRPVLGGDPAADHRQRRRLVVGALSVTMLASMSVGWLIAGRDDVGPETPSAPTTGPDASIASASVTVSGGEVDPPTTEPADVSSTPATNEAPTASSVVLADPVDEVAPSELDRARNDLVAVVAEIPDDQLKSKEAEKLIEDVDNAIEAARDGDSDKAEQEFDQALERVEKKLDDEARSETITDTIARIARLAGVEI